MKLGGKRVARILIKKRRGMTTVTMQALGARGGYFSLGSKSSTSKRPGALVLELVPARPAPGEPIPTARL